MRLRAAFVLLLPPVAFAATSCGSPMPAPLSPAAQAVVQYFRDLDSHDCQAAYRLLTDPLLTRVGGEDAFCIASPSAVNRSVTVDQVAAANTRAVVTVTVVKQDGTRRQDRVTAMLIRGAWKVGDITAVSANGTTLFDVNAALTQVRAGYLGKTGRALTTLSCGKQGLVSVAPGDVIICAYTDGSGVSGALDITIGQDGVYTWSTSGASNPPSNQSSSSPPP
jgi:hypothetical protein